MAALWMRGAVLGVVVAGLTACASLNAPVKGYDGPTRPVAELAVLSVPDTIQVMSVDGLEPNISLLGQRALTLQVLPGEHVLSVRYVELFEHVLTSDDHEIVRSRPVAIRFTAKAGSTYSFKFEHPKNIDAAHAFAKAPQVDLIDASGAETAQSVVVKSYAQASLMDTISKAFQSNEQPKDASTNLDLLKDVWGRASADERTAFKAWIDGGAKP